MANRETGRRWGGCAVGPRRCRTVIVLALLAGLAVPGELRAHGLGVHVAVGQGDHGHRQFGLSWDTAVASDQLLNFRMNLGYERFELADEWGYHQDYSGVILEETLGVRLLANERVRLWAGPHLVTAVYDGDGGIGGGVALGGNLHLGEITSLAVTLGVRRMFYSGFLGGDEKETIGTLRFDLFFRLPGDRFARAE